MLFKTAIVRKPGPNFSQGLTTFAGPPPDYEKALDQHDAYCAALERCGLQVVRIAPDLAHPDSTFVEDTVVLTGDFAVLTRPGAPTRAGEVEAIREPLQRFFRDIREIKAPGTLDGGDICQADRHFFIGISQRTNEAGAAQLARLLAEHNYTSSFIDIRPLHGILHLKSELASLDQGRLVISPSLAALPQFRDYELIRLDSAETCAANCVHVNHCVLIADGFPNFAAALSRHGYQPLPLAISEFAKMDGGLSCLSLRF
jgi:dimethylargininase